MGAAKQSAASPPPSIEGEAEVSATVAKNEFGRVLDMALRGGRVVITKHNAPTAVGLSADADEAPTGRANPGRRALPEPPERLLIRLHAPTHPAAAAACVAPSP